MIEVPQEKLVPLAALNKHLAPESGKPKKGPGVGVAVDLATSLC